MGDPAGIGIEIIIKTFMDNRMMDFCTPVIFSSKNLINSHRKVLNFDELNFNTINSIKEMQGGELFVPTLQSYKVLDVAKAINSKAKITYIGIRPGEKVHEQLITSGDAINTKEFKSSNKSTTYIPYWLYRYYSSFGGRISC